MNQAFAFVIAATLALPALAQEVEPARAEMPADVELASGVEDNEAEVSEAEASEGVTNEEEIFDPLAPRDASEVTLAEFQWIARPVIIFADTPADPRFQEQIALLASRPDPLLERNVVVITDTDPSARSELRQELRPRGFALVVMTKDGSVGFRRPSPRDVREITRGIDNFALRQEELRSGN